MRNSLAVSQKKSDIEPSNSTPKYIFKRIESRASTQSCIPVTTAALFTITKSWKQPKCTLTDKQNGNIHNRILFNLKRNEILIHL